MKDDRRVVLPRKMLLPILIGWLSHAPKWVWGKEPGFERLKRGKTWFDPFAEPDAKEVAAEMIVNEMDRLGWIMCQPVTSSSQELLQSPCEGCAADCDDVDAAPSNMRPPHTSHSRRRR